MWKIICMPPPQIAQTTLRSVCGSVELDELLSEREKLNLQLQEIIRQANGPLGCKGCSGGAQKD
jgi:regulator of protease activity HflC (stomatin/prohibitin superfamily)